MNNLKNQSIDHQVKKEAKLDLIQQFLGILAALIPVLAILGINLNWLTDEFISSLGVLLSAIALFGVNAYAIYKNHFSGKQAQKQNHTLKQRGLK